MKKHSTQIKLCGSALLAGLLFLWGCQPSGNPYSAPDLLSNLTPTATNVPGSPTLTLTPAPPTVTPTFTRTFTPAFTPTFTFTSAFTPTSTFTPVYTHTPTPTFTFAFTATPTATLTATDTPTNSFTPGATSTPTNSFTPASTPTATNSFTSQPTNTFTATSTDTASPTPQATATSTPTCAAANGSFIPATWTNGEYGSEDYITARPITVTGIVSINDYQLYGINNSTSAITENIALYADAGGTPGTLIASGSGPIAGGTGSAGSAGVTFSSPVQLTSGVYWIAADSNGMTSAGFGVYQNLSVTDSVDVTGSGSSSLSMPAVLGGTPGSGEPSITADWVCP